MNIDIKKLFALTGCVGFAVLCIAFFLFVRPQLPSFHPEAFRNFLLSLGPRAVFVFLFLYAFRYLFALSMTLLTMLAGVVWGVWGGTLYATIGATLNALFLFFLARFFGQKPFQSFFSRKESLLLLIRFIERKAFASILVLRLVQVLAFEGPAVLAGVSRISALPFALATFIGISPYMLIYAYSGTQLKDLSPEGISRAGLPVLVISLFSLSLVVFFRKPMLAKLAQWENRANAFPEETKTKLKRKSS